MIEIKLNLMGALMDRGFSPKRLIDEKVFSAGTVQKLREQDPNMSMKTLNTLCVVLNCQPNDIIKVISTEEEKEKLFTDYWIKNQRNKNQRL